MKKLMVLFFIVQACLSFAVVVDYSDLNSAQQARAVADLNGKVNCTEEFLAAESFPAGSRVLPDLADGWPQSYPSSNCYKGAIYANMDEDPELEIIYGVGTKIVAKNIDGSNVAGWPQQLSFYIWSSPACGDIDGDGAMEIVGCSRNNTNGNAGELYAFEMDGTAVGGFPVVMAGGGTMNASLADIDGDEDLEICVNVRNHPNGWTYIFDGDGSVMPGWPQQLDTFPGSGVSISDLNNDGEPEVICLSYESLYVFDTEGNVLDGFPVSEAGYNYSYSQPILADIDDDGIREIIYGGCSEGGAVFAINYDGTPAVGWPQTVDYWIFGNPALADIDGDEELEIVIGDQVSSSTPVNHIHAWNGDGSGVTGFPAGPTNAIYAQVGIADLDGDELPEIMIDDNVFGNGYECYNDDGSHCVDWPLPAGTGWDSITMQMTPVFGDIDLDGNLEIMGAATGFTSWLVELCLWNTDSPWNEDLAYMAIDGCNIQHTGEYAQELAPPPPPVPDSCMANPFDYNDIMVSWVMEDSGQTSFNLYINGEQCTEEIASEDREISLYGFNEGEYTFYVTAMYDDIESDPSPEATVTIGLPAPQNLTFDNLCTTVGLYWNSPSQARNLTAYNVYRDGEVIATIADTTYEDTDLPEAFYQYWITAIYSDSLESAASNIVDVEVTDADETELTPAIGNVSNYPNPFNPTTNIYFELDSSQSLKVSIYNSRGQEVKALADKYFTQGMQQLIWTGKDNNGAEMPSGIYLLNIKGDTSSYSHKLLLLK